MTNDISTKQRLLAAAIKVFASKGLNAATIREICQEAEVNVAAVNYHFGDKAELYATVLNHIFQKHQDRRDPELSSQAQNGPTPEKRLLAHIQLGVFQTYDKECECAARETESTQECAPYSIFLMEMAHPSPGLDKIVKTFIKPDADQLGDILNDFFEGKAKPSIIHYCANSIWGQILHPAMCWPIDFRLHGNHALALIEPETLAEHTFQFTLGGLKQIKKQLDKIQSEV